MKPRFKLLASASTQVGIEGLINDYFHSKRYIIRPGMDANEWTIVNTALPEKVNLLNSLFRVVQAKSRFRFEGLVNLP